MEVDEQPAQDLWETRLDNAFKETLDEGEMILRWVAIAEVIDKDGERGLYTMTSPGIQAWESLGLLEFGAAREKGSIALNDLVRTEIDDEEEDGDTED